MYFNYFIIISVIKDKAIVYEDKVISRRGILGSKEDTITTHSIISVSIDQSILGSLFNFGTISIGLSGFPSKRFTYIKGARTLKNSIELLKKSN